MPEPPLADPREVSAGLRPESPVYSFADFVEPQVRSQTNDFSAGFDLNIALTTGQYSHSVALDGEPLTSIMRYLRKAEPLKKQHTFRVRLLHCNLRYRLAGCTIPIETKYRYSVQAGAFRNEVQERFKTATRLAAGASAAASGKASILGGTFKVEGKTDLDAKVSTEDADLMTAKITPEIAVIEHAPNGWVIGHPSLGDPFQATSEYCLNGSYFVEHAKGYDHTCRVEFAPHCHAAKLSFLLTARDGFHVERVEEPSSSAKPATGEDKRALSTT